LQLKPINAEQMMKFLFIFGSFAAIRLVENLNGPAPALGDMPGITWGKKCEYAPADGCSIL